MGIELGLMFWLFLGTFVLLLIEGLYCLLVTYNLMRVLIGIEMIIKAVTLFVIACGYVSGQTALAQSFVITVIVIEVVVVVVAAGIILGFFTEYDSLNVRNARNLRG
ncbi:MAG: NADH-quinone oxidoreductase subunit K [Candidatus Margulisiibacteriota bacterium]